MRSFIVGAWVVATVVSVAANGDPVGEGKSATSVIDVEFWGLRQLRSENPDDGTQDLITYGDPVHGTFRIWTEDAPPANLTSSFLDYQDARVYGRDEFPVRNPSPASFVTSRWLSPFPAGYTGVEPLAGGVADDHVTIGDALQFGENEPLKDMLRVSDNFTENFHAPGESRNTLFVRATTTSDVIQGIGLDQEFELVTPVESGNAGYGFVRAQIEGVRSFFQFAVERLVVSKSRVCRP